MIKIRLSHIILTAAFACMALYPPMYGAAVFLIALSFVGIMRVIEFRESPDLVSLRAEFKEIKSQVERILLKGNR